MRLSRRIAQSQRAFMSNLKHHFSWYLKSGAVLAGHARAYQNVDPGRHLLCGARGGHRAVSAGAVKATGISGMYARGWVQAVAGVRVLEMAAAEEADAEHALRLQPRV
jgi:hypothetical protein